MHSAVFAAMISNSPEVVLLTSITVVVIQTVAVAQWHTLPLPDGKCLRSLETHLSRSVTLTGTHLGTCIERDAGATLSTFASDSNHVLHATFPRPSYLTAMRSQSDI